MTLTLTFAEYVKNELKEDDTNNKDCEYDDYSIVIDVDYTSQE